MKKIFNWFKKFNQDTKATWFAINVKTRVLIAFAIITLVTILAIMALV